MTAITGCRRKTLRSRIRFRAPGAEGYPLTIAGAGAASQECFDRRRCRCYQFVPGSLSSRPLMKLRVLLPLFFSAFYSLLLGAPEEPQPLFPAKLVCHNGKLDSGSKCSSTLGPRAIGVSVRTGTLSCGFSGAVSEIRWRFRGQKDGHDLYHFSRKFPSDAAEPTTAEAEIAFDGHTRKIIFQDAAQCIDIEAPQPAAR